MTLIHTNEPFTGLTIGQESTWGTAASGSGAETYYSLPLVQPGESMAGKRDPIQEPRAFGGTGAREAPEFGRFTGGGSITVEARYDSIGFNILLAHALFGEQVVLDKWVDDSSNSTIGNIHIYAPGTTVPIGLTIKVWKAGVGPAASGYIETYTGCMIGSWRLDQANDQRGLFTFNFSSKAPTIAAGSGTIPAIGGVNILKFRDISRTLAYFKVGNTLTAHSIDQFTLEYDRKLEADPPFATSPDTVDKPGASDIRDVRIRFAGRLEQDYYANDKPMKEFINKTTSKVDILFVGENAVQSKFYALRIELPKVDWEEGRAPLSDPGNPPTNYVGVCSNNSFAAPTGTATTGECRLITAVKNTDEPSVDAKFSNV